MKRLITFFVCMAALSVFGQKPLMQKVTTRYEWTHGAYEKMLIIPEDTTFSKFGIAKKGKRVFIGDGTKWEPVADTTGGNAIITVQTIAARDSIDSTARYEGLISYVKDSTKYYSLVGGIDNEDWQEFQQGGGTPYDSTIDLEDPVSTAIPGLQGKVFGEIDIKEAIRKILYQSDPPLMTLTGGAPQELMSSGANVTKTVSWSITRQDYTEEIDSVFIADTSISFSQPDKPGVYGSNRNVSIPRNTTTVVSGRVKTVDGQEAFASTTFTWVAPRFVLWVTDTTGISSGSLDATIISGTKDLSNSKTKTYNTGVPSGTQYPVYVYIASAGELTSLKMNGFESIGAWKTTTRTLTTGTGYTGSFRIYWGNNGQTAASNIEAF